MYLNCPHKWRLRYVEKHRFDEPNINLVFGTAMHNTLQGYLKVVYGESAKKADGLPLGDFLRKLMMMEYASSLEKNNNKHFTTPQELAEYHQDGVYILDYIRRHRSVYFPTKQHELVGVELPLHIKIGESLFFDGFVDVVIRDKRDNTIRVWDIKTSTSGWNKYQKKDITKTAQLILYKKFYAEQYKVSEDQVEVEYLIVRRKINDQAEFVPKRVQTFIPASGKVTQKKVSKMLTEFVSHSFNTDGSFKTDAKYTAIASSGCKYCPYVQMEDLCPKGERIKKEE